MADVKITGLPELAAAAANADILEIVDDVAGTPTSKKITRENLMGDLLTAARITGMTAETTINDADLVEIVDDVAGTPTSKKMTRDNFMDHNIAYHNDTTATGADLNTLTDGSIADSLHDHAILSDTSGNTVVSVDSGKIVGISNRVFLDGRPGSTGAGYIDIKNNTPATTVHLESAGDSYFTGGGVVIGATSTSYQLELSTDSAGKPGAGGLWTIVSGKEVKTEIELADINLCYENFKKTKLKRYKYRPDCYSDKQIKDRHVLGFVADDIETIYKKSVCPKKFIKEPEVSQEIIIQEEKKDKDGKITQPLKTQKKIIKKEVSIQTKDLNLDQKLMEMFGTVARLQEIVEGQQKEIDTLKKELISFKKI